MKTIWQAEDRQGVKYFSKRPEFLAMHDVFVGERCELPKKRRIIKRFKVKVRGWDRVFRLVSARTTNHAMNTQETAERLARECANMVAFDNEKRDWVKEHILDSIPLVELLNVVEAGNALLDFGYADQTLIANLDKSLTALRSKLPKENE